MRYCQIENCLSFLPTQPKNRKKWDFAQNVEVALSKVSVNEDFDFQQKVVRLIIEKSRGINPEWEREDYLFFQQQFRRATMKQIQFSKHSIIQCLSLPDYEIVETLDVISRREEFYPEVVRIYIPDKNRYEIIPKERSVMDCFVVLNRLYSTMYSFICKESEKIMSSDEDFGILYQTLLDISKSESFLERQPYLQNFEDSFSYLQNTSLYRDLYEQFRFSFFEILLSKLSARYDCLCRLEYSNRSQSYYEHKNDRLIHKAKQF